MLEEGGNFRPNVTFSDVGSEHRTLRDTAAALWQN